MEKSRTNLNIGLSLAIAYVYLAAQANNIVPVYKIVTEQVTGLTFLVVALLALLTIITFQQWQEKRKLIKAVLSSRKHGKLSKMVRAGVHAKSFAYLKSEHDYGVGSKLPPMTIVYVVHVDSDMSKGTTAWVIPKFKEQVTGVELADKPCLAIEVMIDNLYPHVPAHLIPELV